MKHVQRVRQYYATNQPKHKIAALRLNGVTQFFCATIGVVNKAVDRMKEIKAFVTTIADGTSDALQEEEVLQAFVAQQENVVTLTNLAYYYAEEAEDFSKALHYIERAILQKPITPQPFMIYSYVLVKLERYEEALSLVEYVYKHAPSQAAYYNVAGAYYRNERYLEAGRAYELAGANYTYQAAMAYSKAGDTTKATQLLAMIPQDEPLARADVYVLLERYDDALVEMDKALPGYALDTWCFVHLQLAKRVAPEHYTALYAHYEQLLQAELCEAQQQNIDEWTTEQDIEQAIMQAKQVLAKLAAFEPLAAIMIDEDFANDAMLPCCYYFCPMHDTGGDGDKEWASCQTTTI